MAITTYSELKTATANWLVRADLTARIPEFITLAEARLNRVMRMRLAETDAGLTATPSSRFIALPATFAEALNCWIVIDGERIALEYASPVLLEASAVVGRPQSWGIDGANLAFERPSDAAYSIILRHLVKYALSDASPTNNLLTIAPDIYLWATISEGAAYSRDATLEGRAESKLQAAIAELNAKDARAKSQQRLQTEPGELTRYRRRNGYNIMTDYY